MAREQQDDEWEYEYDQDETEDFYITLDMSNVPSNDTSGLGFVHARLASRPLRLQSKLRQDMVRRPEGMVTNPTNPEETAAESTGEMQIINLDTQNPLAVYNGQLLSCKWASTIGTDMFFVKSGSGAEAGEQPLRSLPAVDLLAISSTKLVAKTARLRPRDELFEGLQAQEESNVIGTDISQRTESGPQVPTGFLAKLNEVKAKRGENSRLEVLRNSDGSSRVIATIPSNPAATARSSATSEDDEMEED
jgi:hypothetical protein